MQLGLITSWIHLIRSQLLLKLIQETLSNGSRTAGALRGPSARELRAYGD